MIEINLLPGAKKKTRRGGGGRQLKLPAALTGLAGGDALKDKWLLGAVASLILAAAALGWLYTSQSRAEAALLERQEKAVADSTRYAAVLRERVRAEATRDTVLRQLTVIRSIDDDRFIWPHIMDEVSKALPLYTWITIMGYGGTPQGSTNIVGLPQTPKKAGPDTVKIKKPPVIETTPPRDQVMLRITGRTVDVQAMTRFISQLEDSPFLSNVYLERSTPNSEAGSDYYQFQLIINYTRPDSMAVRRLPLLVAGRAAGR